MLVTAAPAYASIAKKLLMAVSGIVFVGFVIGHMLGNLQIFIGRDRLNAYAETLQHLGAILWIIRGFLAIFLILHVYTGLTLYLENRRSRPTKYIRKDTVQASVSSRTMFFSGLGIIIYVVYHLLHFTFLATNPQYADLVDATGRRDVFTMIITGYSNYYISAAYILAMIVLAFHLNHAVPSLFQTLGLNNQRWRPLLERLGTIVAIVVLIGYVSIPVAVLLNLVRLPGGF
jgi:succinate dehydrogenase / fumarate reductase cytochrome b subunit